MYFLWGKIGYFLSFKPVKYLYFSRKRRNLNVLFAYINCIISAGDLKRAKCVWMVIVGQCNVPARKVN